MNMLLLVMYLLSWDYALPAPHFAVYQCRKLGPHCPMQHVVTVDGAAREVALGPFTAHKNYCWEVRIPETGQASNRVCSP
jgi:hypothetical protein